MHRLKTCVIIYATVAYAATSTNANELAFNFSGGVTFIAPEGTTGQGGWTYGIRLPNFSSLSGHFLIETNTPSYAIPGCDCKGYVHKQTNGFYTTFDGLTAQADEYIVQLRNNVNVAGYGTADVLSLLYPDPTIASNPAMSKPLLISGNSVFTGSIRIDLVAHQNTFASSDLPATLTPVDFLVSQGTSTFGDGVPVGLDVLFKLQSLSSKSHLLSDHDLDGDVDGRDFLTWQSNYGGATGNGDANSDLIVDNLDLEIWQSEYGLSNSSILATQVPEPDGFIILVCVSFVFVCRRL